MTLTTKTAKSSMKLTKNSKGMFILTDNNGKFIQSVTLVNTDHIIKYYKQAENVTRLGAQSEVSGFTTFYGNGLDSVDLAFEPEL